MIYVDPLRATAPFTRANTPRCFRNTVSCHMWSDGGTEELVAFGRRIGLRPEWIQRPGTEREHFDLTASRRGLAVALGAVEVARWARSRAKVKDGRLTKRPSKAGLLAETIVSSVLLLSAPALAAPPAPPGPLAALAHQAAVEAAAERGDPLEDLLRAVLAEELALEEPVDVDDEPAEDDEEAELDPAEEPADGEERQAFGAVLAGNLVAAGWCAVYQDEPEEGAPGCDFGVGAAFWRSRRGRLFLAGVVGQKTAGFGFGVTAYRSRDGRVIVAGAVGVVAPYDDGRGIDAGRAALAIGATFGIGGR